MSENLRSLYRLIIYRVRVQVFISDWDGAKVSSYLLIYRKKCSRKNVYRDFTWFSVRSSMKQDSEGGSAEDRRGIGFCRPPTKFRFCTNATIFAYF
jgi:hypothetical protein